MRLPTQQFSVAASVWGLLKLVLRQRNTISWKGIHITHTGYPSPHPQRTQEGVLGVVWKRKETTTAVDGWMIVRISDQCRNLRSHEGVQLCSTAVVGFHLAARFAIASSQIGAFTHRKHLQPIAKAYLSLRFQPTYSTSSRIVLDMASLLPGTTRTVQPTGVPVVARPFARHRPVRNVRGQVVRAHAGSDVDEYPDPSRRSLLAGLATFPALTSIADAQARALEFLGIFSAMDYNAVKSDIVSIIKDDPDKGPTMLRLAWHSSGTYDQMSRSGGSGKGTIRFKEELAHGANAGLYKAVDWLEPIHEKYADQGLSYADLYTLAGVAAVDALGGPKVTWRSGRVDAMDPVEVPPEGRLPAADKGSPKATASHLRDVFYRMGFNDQEIVALTGAHTLGRGHADASGYDGPWTPTPTRFSNLYYTFLLNIKWETETLPSGVKQYTDANTKKLMMLPADLVMIEDDEFKKWVEVYAKDEQKFFADFAVAFQKLEELGCAGLRNVSLA